MTDIPYSLGEISSIGDTAILYSPLAKLALLEGLNHTVHDHRQTEMGVDEALQNLEDWEVSGTMGENPVSSDPWRVYTIHHVNGAARGQVYRNRGQVTIAVAARTREEAEHYWIEVMNQFPHTEVKDPEVVPVRFWSLGTNGPTSITRNLDVQTWDNIQDHYPTTVHNELSTLMHEDFRPGHGGRLILWHGPPGTGKTTALRSLASQWREWARFHYVVDPDAMFAQQASYMMNVLVDDDETDKWRVLILEDAGELISADAKSQVGQGLSRMLNVVDGMLGQGLKVLVLITTNEPLRKLHEAMARPGRCASQIEFTDLNPEEVMRWADTNSIEVRPKSMSLADLFAIREGFNQEEREQVGFGLG